MAMGKVVGGIGFSSFRSGRSLPDELIPRLRLVGDIFTNALARKRGDEALRAKEQALRQAKLSLENLASRLIHSQEEERARIAREMHDDWTQRLALLGIDAAKLESQLDSKESALLLVQSIRAQMTRLAEDVHALSRQLHPSIIDDLGLAEALRSECVSFSQREGIDIDYSHENVPAKLPKDVALCIYRVAQESLRNIAKHAAVKCALVKLVADERELRLRVTDHGIGFDPESRRSQLGLGLSSMEERVGLVRGKLTVDSTRGKGTTVHLRVPIRGGT
jgi:signal transduction histidine kinase